MDQVSFNTLPPRVKLSLIQSYLTLDSMNKTLKMLSSSLLELFLFVILENLSILDLALSGVKGLNTAVPHQTSA